MKYQYSKAITKIFLAFTLIVSVLGGLTLGCETDASSVPSYEAVDLSYLESKADFSPEDYALLWEQTGLSKTIIDNIEDKEERNQILIAEQKRLFTKADLQCTGLVLFSKAELYTDSQNNVPLYDLQPGDVLLTKSTHTLCYRHGHSALYLGDNKLLEAAAIGTPTEITDAAYWGSYPSGLHLRLKENVAEAIDCDTASLGIQVATYAEKELQNDDYHLLAGAFGIGVETNQTQCAHLIYAAYAHCGIEISPHEFPVTPHSLLTGGKFEILRCWGFDPTDINW